MSNVAIMPRLLKNAIYPKASHHRLLAASVPSPMRLLRMSRFGKAVRLSVRQLCQPDRISPLSALLLLRCGVESGCWNGEPLVRFLLEETAGVR